MVVGAPDAYNWRSSSALRTFVLATFSSTEHIERGLRAYGAVQQQAAVNFHGLPAKPSRGLAGSRGLESGVNQ